MQPQLGAPGALAAGWGSLTSLASGLTLSWDSHSALCVTPSRDRGTLLCVPLVQGPALGPGSPLQNLPLPVQAEGGLHPSEGEGVGRWMLRAAG